MSSQKCIEDQPAMSADVVAMGVGTFANQAMGSEHAEFAADSCRLAALLLFGSGWPGIEQGLQIPVFENR